MLERHISNCFLKPPIAITWPILLSLQGVPRKIANSPVAIFCFPNMHQVGAPFSHHIRRLKHIKSYWPMNSHHITIKYIKWSLHHAEERVPSTRKEWHPTLRHAEGRRPTNVFSTPPMPFSTWFQLYMAGHGKAWMPLQKDGHLCIYVYIFRYVLYIYIYIYICI